MQIMILKYSQLENHLKLKKKMNLYLHLKMKCLDGIMNYL